MPLFCRMLHDIIVVEFFENSSKNEHKGNAASWNCHLVIKTVLCKIFYEILECDGRYITCM